MLGHYTDSHPVTLSSHGKPVAAKTKATGHLCAAAPSPENPWDAAGADLRTHRTASHGGRAGDTHTPDPLREAGESLDRKSVV